MKEGPLANPGYHLWHAARRWLGAVEGALSGSELTPTQFFLLGSLVWLDRAGERPMQRELAAHAGVDPMTASTVLRHLEGAGLLSRGRDAKDSRVMRLSPTQAGTQKVLGAAPKVVAVSKQFFAPVGADLQGLVKQLKQLSAPPAGSTESGRKIKKRST